MKNFFLENNIVNNFFFYMSKITKVQKITAIVKKCGRFEKCFSRKIFEAIQKLCFIRNIL